MKDKISIDRIATLHPKVRQPFTDFINEIEDTFGLKVRVVSAGRTFAEQQALYNQGRITPGKIVTWALPGTSYHNYMLAIDAAPFKADGSDIDWNYDFHKWVPIATKHGIECGINFPPHKTDPDHFQITFGFNWRQFADKYYKKDFIQGTQYINL